MNNPEYRLATLCPMGMSEELKNYLNKSTPDGGLMKEFIANNLIDPFLDSKLPYAGIALGWAAPQFVMESLVEWMNSLCQLTVSDGSTPISLEMLASKKSDGAIAIAGFYPISDLQSSEAVIEYNRVSIQQNNQTTEKMLDFAYRQVLCGAIGSDQIGIICVIVAESGTAAESKLKEALLLLTSGDTPILKNPASP
jgi:hypothetical protein